MQLQLLMTRWGLRLGGDTGRNTSTEYKQALERSGLVERNLSPIELLLNTGLRYLPATFSMNSYYQELLKTK